METCGSAASTALDRRRSSNRPSEDTLSEQLADFIVALDKQSLPAPVALDSTRRLSDCIGVSCVGARQEFAAAISGVLDTSGGAREATVIGRSIRTSASLAAMANGAYAHGTDYDDTHGLAVTHITSVVVPTALAMAERLGASGAELLTAIVAGAETGLRIAAPAGQRLLMRGLHVTGVVGPFAAAATAARLLGCDASATAHALGLAGSRAAGLRQGSQDGSWVKRLHSGWAAEAGIGAAMLAAGGFTGPREVLEGKYGLYAGLLNGEAVDSGAVCQGLGEHWLYPEATYKLFPNGSWNHAATAAVAEIVHRERIALEDIVHIDCALPPVGIAAVCEPRDVRLHPKSAYHMKFSLPYSIAMILARGGIDPEDFTDETLANTHIATLAALVHCQPDTSLDPTTFPARVSLTTRNGDQFVMNVDAQKGSLANPLTQDEHRERFLSFAAPTLGAQNATRLWTKLERAWDVRDARAITQHLRVRPPNDDAQRMANT